MIFPAAFIAIFDLFTDQGVGLVIFQGVHLRLLIIVKSVQFVRSQIQFSAECNPPVPARKAMFMRSGFSGFACEQFHRHAPQWPCFFMPFSISNQSKVRAQSWATFSSVPSVRFGVEAFEAADVGLPCADGFGQVRLCHPRVPAELDDLQHQFNPRVFGLDRRRGIPGL